MASIRLFENILAIGMGVEAEICAFKDRCGSYKENYLDGILDETHMRRIRTLSAQILFTVILVALPLTVYAVGSSSQDKALLAAHDAFLAGDRVRLARHAEKIQGHALDIYVSFWRLRLRLEEAGPGEVRAFLAKHSGTVLAEQLRRDWLRVLGRTGQWGLFREEQPALVKDDPDVACYALQERWRRQDASALGEVKSFWRAHKALPEGCVPLADVMLKSGELTQTDLSDRFRLLAQANLLTEAKWVLERLPAEYVRSIGQIDRITKAPARFLDQSGADLNTAVGRELTIFALTRLAQSDLQRAVQYWSGELREGFPLGGPTVRLGGSCHPWRTARPSGGCGLVQASRGSAAFRRTARLVCARRPQAGKLAGGEKRH